MLKLFLFENRLLNATNRFFSIIDVVSSRVTVHCHSTAKHIHIALTTDKLALMSEVNTLWLLTRDGQNLQATVCSIRGAWMTLVLYNEVTSSVFTLRCHHVQTVASSDQSIQWLTPTAEMHAMYAYMPAVVAPSPATSVCNTECVTVFCPAFVHRKICHTVQIALHFSVTCNVIIYSGSSHHQDS